MSRPPTDFDPMGFNTGNDAFVPWVGDNPTNAQRRAYLFDFFAVAALMDDAEASGLETGATQQVAKELHQAGETRILHNVFAYRAAERLWQLVFQDIAFGVKDSNMLQLFAICIRRFRTDPMSLFPSGSPGAAVCGNEPSEPFWSYRFCRKLVRIAAHPLVDSKAAFALILRWATICRTDSRCALQWDKSPTTCSLLHELKLQADFSDRHILPSPLSSLLGVMSRSMASVDVDEYEYDLDEEDLDCIIEALDTSGYHNCEVSYEVFKAARTAWDYPSARDNAAQFIELVNNCQMSAQSNAEPMISRWDLGLAIPTERSKYLRHLPRGSYYDAAVKSPVPADLDAATNHSTGNVDVETVAVEIAPGLTVAKCLRDPRRYAAEGKLSNIPNTFSADNRATIAKLRGLCRHTPDVFYEGVPPMCRGVSIANGGALSPTSHRRGHASTDRLAASP
ncbi:hypothetical protein B0J13DRAFT_680330 [Dactylonectria estremocensis]|uniref:Uncharacterized protein n=1 Tax=Dactylonectria estremocensis TaxID=1079267 RepID=A0A9P9DNF9_9HYPO|nr:hypothetical protein B0J13DRAFT_680330 [Dactylonectria estremocensis]